MLRNSVQVKELHLILTPNCDLKTNQVSKSELLAAARQTTGQI